MSPTRPLYYSIQRMLLSYTQFLHSWRYTSQSLTAGTLWFAGDIISQRLTWPQGGEESTSLKTTSAADTTTLDTSDKKPRPFGLSSIDWSRAAVMTSFGLFIAGPLFTFWYRLLDEKMVHIVAKWYAKRSPPGGQPLSDTRLVWSVTLAKVAADMLIFDPPYLSLFFSYTNLLSGHSFKDSMSLCAKELPHTYLVDVALWTPVQLINFRFVPVLYQPLLVNGVNTGWNAYLSFVQNKEGSSTGVKVVT